MKLNFSGIELIPCVIRITYNTYRIKIIHICSYQSNTLNRKTFQALYLFIIRTLKNKIHSKLYAYFMSDIIKNLSVQTYLNLLDDIVSVLPFLNHFTSIGWSPVTLHCKVAVSPSLVETVLEVDENRGEAKHRL